MHISIRYVHIMYTLPILKGLCIHIVPPYIIVLLNWISTFHSYMPV